MLDEVGQEFEQERAELQQSLQQQVYQLMGDTPINLNSPEQLSWVIYSRKPKDKSVWANSTHPYMKDVQYRDAVRTQTQVVYKTKAVKCEACNGTGYIRKTKKNGEPFSKPNKCVTCAASGFIYEKLPKVAGLKFNAPSAKWASANGFSTSKDNLKTLSSIARQKGMEEARQFLEQLFD